MTTRKADQLTQQQATAAPTARIAAMQNPLDRLIYHPLAFRLARMLSKTPVTPNAVSIAGGLVIVMAGIAYTRPGGIGMIVLGMAFHLSWHILDGADGDLARLTGRTSPAGEIIDGVCDYSGHIILYLMLAGAAYSEPGWLSWLLAVLAGFSRIVQANFYESRRRQFLNWAYDVPWLRTTQAQQTQTPRGMFRMLATYYLALADRIAPKDDRIDAALADPANGEQRRALIRELGIAPFAGSSLLGANYRTLALAAAMVAGSPMWYFLYEIVVLNPVLILSMRRSRRAIRLIEAEM